MTEDHELLRRFAEEGAQEAFTELVRRKVDLVYAAAMRQTGGDAHLAGDVTQAVFVALARQAQGLKRHPVLTGWFFTTTRFFALDAQRRQRRWQRREREAHTMTTNGHEAEPAWAELRPVIDEALNELGERDRVALLLRFFERRSLADVGRSIGLAENSARMCVDRALEKLRLRLARRGITSTAAALGLVLANQPAVAAPAGLVATVAGASLTAAAMTGAGGLALALELLKFMQTTKLTLGVLGAIAAVGLGAYLGTTYGPARVGTTAAVRPAGPEAALMALREENRGLKAELARQRTAPSLAAEGSVAIPVTPEAGPARQLDSLRVLAELQKKKWVEARMTFVDRSGKITDSFASLFGLTTAEQEALQGTVVRAREQLAELERANATMSPRPDGTIEIKVKAFPVEGGVVYDELMARFAATLGAERDEAYRSLGAEQVETVLGRFGAAERTVTVSRKLPGEGVKQTDKLIVVSEQTRTKGSSSSSSGDYKDLDEVATRIGTLVRLIPPNF